MTLSDHPVSTVYANSNLIWPFSHKHIFSLLTTPKCIKAISINLIKSFDFLITLKNLSYFPCTNDFTKLELHGSVPLHVQFGSAFVEWKMT